MINIEINIKGLDSLAESIAKLATAMRGQETVKSGNGEVMETVLSESSSQATLNSVIPAPAATPVNTASEKLAVTQTMTQPDPVATVQSSYTLDELASAAMALMDSGRMAELQNLLATYGVDSLPGLSPEMYGAFATDLRGLGANI